LQDAYSALFRSLNSARSVHSKFMKRFRVDNDRRASSSYPLVVSAVSN
jgi:hypothetical protein